MQIEAGAFGSTTLQSLGLTSGSALFRLALDSSTPQASPATTPATTPSILSPSTTPAASSPATTPVTSPPVTRPQINATEQPSKSTPQSAPQATPQNSAAQQDIKGVWTCSLVEYHTYYFFAEGESNLD